MTTDSDDPVAVLVDILEWGYLMLDHAVEHEDEEMVDDCLLEISIAEEMLKEVRAEEQVERPAWTQLKGVN